MKKFILAAALAATALTAACVQHKPTKARKYHEHSETVYHFNDGRLGYHDDSGIWYYMLMSQAMSSPSSSTVIYRPASIAPSGGLNSTPLITGGWTKGPTPSKEELDEATESTATVVTDADGKPTDPEEAVEAQQEAAEAATEGTETEATGEASSTTGESTTESGSTESAPSSDSGSSSDSGGGDSGGGGSE